jgi:hypothetical protein
MPQERKLSQPLKFTLPFKIPYSPPKKVRFWGWPSRHQLISLRIRKPSPSSWATVDVSLNYRPPDSEPVFSGYRIALLLASPFRYLYDWVEGRDLEFWYAEDKPPPGFPLSYRMLWPLRDVSQCLRALVFTWLARNGDDWTLARALKASVSLALNLRYDHRKESKQYRYWYSAELAWWGDGDSAWYVSGGPRSWHTIQIATKLDQWWFYIDSDISDYGYP